MAPEVSVALVTRNRPSSLRRSLESIRTQSEQPFEVVVSDDSDAAFREDVERLAREYGCRWLAGPRAGLYANRNFVARACRGTHIRTMDDDHELPAGHLAACHLAVEADPQAVWIVGEYAPQLGVDDPWACPGQLHPRGFSTPPPLAHRSRALADGASIYPRAVFDRGLRYSEAFPFGSAYLEWGALLAWTGHPSRHLSTTYVLHHGSQAQRSFAGHRLELGSRSFAMLMLSFVYEPLLTNQVRTLAELARALAKSPTRAPPALWDGWRAYYRRRSQVKLWKG